MSELVRIARRNEKSRASLFEPQRIDFCPRRDDRQFADDRFRDESIEIAFAHCRIDPHADTREILRRRIAIEQMPRDVITKSLDARQRLLHHRLNFLASKRPDHLLPSALRDRKSL